jgi:hypothetical protein
MSKAAEKKPKPITREELEGMSHKQLAKVATKRRLMASLPSAEDADGDAEDRQAEAENLTPRQRIERGHAQRDRAREARRKGGDDGDDDEE